MIVRDFLLDGLRKELVGPSDGEEILEAHEAPRVRYGAGILFPRATVTSTQEDVQAPADDLNTENTEDVVEPGKSDPEKRPGADNADVTDGEINRANDFLPSAMGITAYGRLSNGLTIKVRYAQYSKITESGSRTRWRRQAVEKSIQVDAPELLTNRNHIVKRKLPSCDDTVGVSLRVFVRAPRSDLQDKDLRLFTITLLNDAVGSSRRGKTDGCLYQCAFKAELGREGKKSYFEQLPSRVGSEDDSEELLSAELLYRHRRVYAVGHGVAPEWHETEDGRCDHIRSEVVPEYEIKPILPAAISGLDLSMETLADPDNINAIGLCRSLASHYATWIEQRADEAGDPQITPAHLKTTAERHLDACKSSLERIERGIDLIEEDSQAREAFALMNRAMLKQQIHYKQFVTQPREWVEVAGQLKLETPFVNPAYTDTGNKWFPFQLAFILMSLPSIALGSDEDIEDRSLIDVIWFPTGGGKTEAYLGLAAFTILWRRLSEPQNGGCTVLTRYTLRLLTTQQFERAATLMCALELLRRNAEDLLLGSEEISIGLWVGGGVTPNKKKDAVKRLNDLARGEGENSFVLLKCPWCGARMGPLKQRGPTRVKGYKKSGRPQSVVMRCEDDSCDFAGDAGLPVKVIDEEIYENPPTLLVGTVDKFALLPWYPESRSIFGIDRENSPPDLVIQDELHLISGPLGSMVGHYETLIEELCRRDFEGQELSCKIVASTATISRAAEQISSLYGRSPGKAKLFPPQGLKAGDSFFAAEDTSGIGRKYAGIFASGLPSQVTTQVRVLGSLLQSPPLAGADAKTTDPYWTLMVYFNSIRELGHAATLINADIPEYIRVIWRRFGLRKIDNEDRAKMRRFINSDLELTGRVPSGEITRNLDRLFESFDGTRSSRPVDICLATNMIQVGLDVFRLGLMAVVGQPKSTAEYIQATSRVGRDVKGPGLVITIFNTGKPRDRSHYEHFRDFHQSIYRHVEPTSVTPFSIRVSERALHAVVITLVRFLDPQSREFPTPPNSKLRDRIRAIIIDRVRIVDPDESVQADKIIDRFFDDWSDSEPDIYGTFGEPGENLPLMVPAGRDPKSYWKNYGYRPTPSSMRNVDAECEVAPVYSYTDDDTE